MIAFRKPCWFLLLAITTLAVPVSHAIPVLSFDENRDRAQNSDQAVGWQFNVLSPITVNGLGWYDEDADGLVLGHDVAIWDPDGNLLTSIFVPAGTATPLDGQFRTASIPPITLATGAGYIVGGMNFNENTERLASNVNQVLDSRVEYVDATFADIGDGFVRPTSFSTATSGFYGPSFSLVPEPIGVVMAMLGVCLASPRLFR